MTFDCWFFSNLNLKKNLSNWLSDVENRCCHRSHISLDQSIDWLIHSVLTTEKKLWNFNLNRLIWLIGVCSFQLQPNKQTTTYVLFRCNQEIMDHAIQYSKRNLKFFQNNFFIVILKMSTLVVNTNKQLSMISMMSSTTFFCSFFLLLDYLLMINNGLWWWWLIDLEKYFKNQRL